MQDVYLEQLGLHFVKTCLTTYLGKVYFFGIFIASIFLFSLYKKNKLRYFTLYTLFLFCTIFNPFLVKLIFGYFDQDEVYYSFFWLLPINIIVSFLFVVFIDSISGYLKKFFLTLSLVCVILFLGTPVINFSSFLSLPDNLYKVPDETLEISEYIHQDATIESPRVAIAPDLLMTIRQYDASLTLTLERDRVLCWQGAPAFQDLQDDYWFQLQKPIMDVIYGGDTSNSDAFSNAIVSTGTHYVVYSKTVDIQDFLSSLGARYVAETDNYIIFRVQ